MEHSAERHPMKRAEIEAISGVLTCDATWPSDRPTMFTDDGRYRQHRCGQAGPHAVHICRYCAKRKG